MAKIANVCIYGLNESKVAAGYPMRSEVGDVDYAVDLGISYALKTYDHSKSKFSTHLFRCVTCRIVNLNKVLTTKNKKEKDIDILSANYEIQEKDGKPQEIIDLIAYDK